MMATPRKTRDKCVCDWPDECDGSGILNCEGCGGDTCICVCDGERECAGCDACRPREQAS